MSQTIKAISLWQPWATLIALGCKQYETRSWATPYRGRLAIHAAKRRPELFEAAMPALARKGYYNRSGGYWIEAAPLPLGCVLCIVRLVDVLPTEQVRREAFARQVNASEFDFGDYSPGRYAWQLELIERLEPPIPARGAQGLWTWTR